MKKILISVLLIMMVPLQSVWANSANNTEETIVIPAGTIVELHLSTPVHSKRNKVGDMLILKVADDVMIDGVLVIQKGSTGLAFISDVKRAGPWGKGGGIKIEADCVWSVNDIKVPITFDFERKGDGHKMLAPVVLFGLCAGYITGNNVSVPPGTKFSAKVVDNTELNISARELNELTAKKVLD